MTLKKTMQCLICGTTVVLSDNRYLALTAAGAKPVCRRNGCYRLFGRDVLDIGIDQEVITLPGNSSVVATRRIPEEGEPVEPLAKCRLKRSFTEYKPTRR